MEALGCRRGAGRMGARARWAAAARLDASPWMGLMRSDRGSLTRTRRSGWGGPRAACQRCAAAAQLNAEAARITAFSRWADVVRRPEERDGHATGQQQAERHHVSAGWRDALWWMGSCYLPASAGRGVGVPVGGVCGPRGPESESSARRSPRNLQNRFCGPRDHSIHQLVRG